MKPRYVIVNDLERTEFEKRWQMPYGYGKCLIFTDSRDAINVLEDHAANNPQIDTSEYIIEKITSEGREFYYRI